ncbi:N-formylglutamate amidohydrolase [Blastomonas sp. AAP53]|uniref:N-formylglutamate amidohydrolase n=1 Tax=Blastomonas sp. AAP53 TaxID=1248760 RepID=UPI000300D71E|nr:N-formylglutamate amidohydrolase [Blastomonas sp. AAP53]
MENSFADDNASARLFSLEGLLTARLPVVVAVPHAGRDYPDEILQNLRVAPHILERLEDRHADMLLPQLEAMGCVTLVAHAARAWIDLNRAPSEVDPHMISDAPRSAFAQPSAKVRGGLGLVPRRLADHGELWRRPLPHAEVAARIAKMHAPYHQALARTLGALQARFGCALLIDLHSMPPVRQEDISPSPQIVIGDRYGRSAGARVCDLAIRTVARSGFQVALNHPYAGGYVLDRHGRPARSIHALQVEVDRSVYLDAQMRNPGDGMERVRSMLAELVQALADDLLHGGSSVDLAIAAE